MNITAQTSFKTVKDAAVFVLRNRNTSVRLNANTLHLPATIPAKRMAVVVEDDAKLAYIDTGDVVYETNSKSVISTLETAYEYGIRIDSLTIDTREFTSNGRRFTAITCDLVEASANS